MGNNKPQDMLAIDGGVKKKWSSKNGKGKANQNPKGKGKCKAKRAKTTKASTARDENRCFQCNGVGHFKRDCPKRKKGASTSNPEGIK